MKVAAGAFLALLGFFAVIASAYWNLSGDPAGTAALPLTFLLCLVIVGWLAPSGPTEHLAVHVDDVQPRRLFRDHR